MKKREKMPRMDAKTRQKKLCAGISDKKCRMEARRIDAIGARMVAGRGCHDVTASVRHDEVSWGIRTKEKLDGSPESYVCLK